MKRSLLVRLLFRRLVVPAGALIFVLPLASAACSAPEGVDAEPIVSPDRRGPDAPPPATPPSLPPVADAIVPLTLDVEIRREVKGQPEVVIQQVVTRTNQRVHLRLDADHEWLLERNPVDGRRVDGSLIVHSRRTIVTYEESAVRNWLGLRGWSDVLTLGLDPDVLDDLASSGEVRTSAGLRFARHTLARPAAATEDDGVSDVWWCAEQALPLRFTTRDAGLTTEVSVRRIQNTVDEDLLRAPAERFPDYHIVDLAEWLEDL